MVSPSTLFSLYFGWLSIVDGFSAVPSAPTSFPEGTTAAAASGVNEDGGVHDTAARKRTGKKSFLHRQALREKDSRTHPPKQIATAIELDDLAASLSQRTPGSHNYYKGYIHYRSLALDAIRHELSSNNLPHPANRTTFENLFFRLGVASDVGSMPSFEDPGARSGYAVEFFCRARNLADSYLDAWNANYDFPEGWVDGLRDSPLLGGDWDGGGDDDRGNDGDGAFSMVSLGGGPGFDYVSAALATTFSSHGRTPSYPRGWHGRPEGSTKIHATILDYEEGWGDLVRAMAESTRSVLRNPDLVCEWGGKCDITQPLSHPHNAAILSSIDSTHLWTCQYCVAENAERLRESEYVFFRELFRGARDGAMFVLSEVHPRLWPEIYGWIEEEGLRMSVGFNKSGRQMLLRKMKNGDGDEGGPTISEKDRGLLQKFTELGKYHERKIDAGFRRQVPKTRGAK